MTALLYHSTQGHLLMVCECCPILLGYCRKIYAFLVTDEELRNTEFVRDLRNFAASLNISAHHWADFLVAKLRDYPGWISTRDGEEWQVRTRLFYDVDTDGYLDPVDLKSEHDTKRVVWFRTFCAPVCTNDNPYIRIEAFDRARAMATILRAVYPKQSKRWGRRK